MAIQKWKPKNPLLNTSHVETRMGSEVQEKWVVWDDGREACVDREVERANVELERLLQEGGRGKDIDVARGRDRDWET